MARFFVSGSNIFGGTAYLNAEDVEHIKVLRIRNGETFTVCDGNGTDYICRLKKTGVSDTEAEIIDKVESAGEPTVRCSVYAAFSKGERPDFIIQKCVELGAFEIIFFPSVRCIAQYDGTALIKKQNRWQKIAREAAMQSGRGIIPQVRTIPSFSHALSSAAQAELSLICYELEDSLSLKDALSSVPEFKNVSVMTGPEGGFEAYEVEAAVSAGLKSVSLGKRILRSETAPMCAVTGVMLFSGNM